MVNYWPFEGNFFLCGYMLISIECLFSLVYVLTLFSLVTAAEWRLFARLFIFFAFFEYFLLLFVICLFYVAVISSFDLKAENLF